MSDYERIRDDVLAAMAKSGKAYTNEVRAMALELRGWREKAKSAEQTAGADAIKAVFAGWPWCSP